MKRYSIHALIKKIDCFIEWLKKFQFHKKKCTIYIINDYIFKSFNIKVFIYV